jgi:hypothetical protein
MFYEGHILEKLKDIVDKEFLIIFQTILTNHEQILTKQGKYLPLFFPV